MLEGLTKWQQQLLSLWLPMIICAYCDGQQCHDAVLRNTNAMCATCCSGMTLSILPSNMLKSKYVPVQGLQQGLSQSASHSCRQLYLCSQSPGR